MVARLIWQCYHFVKNVLLFRRANPTYYHSKWWCGGCGGVGGLKFGMLGVKGLDFKVICADLNLVVLGAGGRICLRI